MIQPDPSSTPAPAHLTAPPTEDTLKSVSLPWWRQRTTYAAGGALLLALGTIAGVWVSPLALPEKITSTTGALTAMLTALAAVFARAGGVNAAGRAQENSRGPL